MSGLVVASPAIPAWETGRRPARLPRNRQFISSIWWLREGMKDTVLNFACDPPLDWHPVSREVNNVRIGHPDLIPPRQWKENCLAEQQIG